MKRLLDHDPVTGVSTVFHGSDDGNTFQIQTVQDAEPILNDNAKRRDVALNKKSEMWHAGTIPNSLILKWKVEEGIDVFSKDPWHKKRVAEKLNSNEFLKLRTKEFKL
jgi:hypothetical protein